MSAFETLYQAWATPTLFAQFGETATYTPSGGAAVSIDAIVERGPLQSPSPVTGVFYDYELAVWVASADVTSLTVGADTIGVKRRITDASATTFKVKALLGQSVKMLHLQLA